MITVEALAKAIRRSKHWPIPNSEELAKELLPFIQANIASVPGGWVLVPIQYTKFMMDAAIRPGSQDQTGRREAAIWNAMIAAAPQPPASQEGAAP